jgi:hypothetical protein
MYPSRESAIKRGAWRKYLVMRTSNVSHYWKPDPDPWGSGCVRSLCGKLAINESQALVIDRKAPRCKKCQNKK